MDNSTIDEDEGAGFALSDFPVIGIARTVPVSLCAGFRLLFECVFGDQGFEGGAPFPRRLLPNETFRNRSIQFV